MNIFRYLDYRKLLLAQIEEHRGIRGYKSKLAMAAGCQKSYLSQVLHSHQNLTLEHGVGLSKFWGLNEQESEYFLDLILLGRAGLPELQKSIRKRIERARKAEKENGERRCVPELTATPESQTRYYSSWHYSAIHIIVSIPEYEDPKLISQRLGLSTELVVKTLIELKAMGLVVNNGNSWQITQKIIHLPKSSPLVVANHLNWQSRAAIDSQKEDTDSFHYSSVLSLSMSDFERVRGMVEGIVNDTRKIIEESDEEEVAGFNCDFFRL